MPLDRSGTHCVCHWLAVDSGVALARLAYALALHPAGSLSRVAIPVAIGLALLAPSIPVLLEYTAWLFDRIA